MIDTRNGRAPLSDFVAGQAMPSTSLLELTNDKSPIQLDSKVARRSGLEIRIAAAWQAPLDQISCAHCRALVGQKLGLKWLSSPVAKFVSSHPRAECDLYPGDLTVVALISWREMYEIAPDETQKMLSADYGWLRHEAACDSWSGSILKQAVAALDESQQS